jgi:hypothetical protein
MPLGMDGVATMLLTGVTGDTSVPAIIRASGNSIPMYGDYIADVPVLSSPSGYFRRIIIRSQRKIVEGGTSGVHIINGQSLLRQLRST